MTMFSEVEVFFLILWSNFYIWFSKCKFKSRHYVKRQKGGMASQWNCIDALFNLLHLTVWIWCCDAVLLFLRKLYRTFFLLIHRFVLLLPFLLFQVRRRHLLPRVRHITKQLPHPAKIKILLYACVSYFYFKCKISPFFLSFQSCLLRCAI